MRIFTLLLITLPVLASTATAQQTNVETGIGGAGDSYSQFIGSRWGVRGSGWFFNFGGGAPGGGAAPPFGFNGGGGLNGGFGFGGSGVSGGLNFTASQGSSRSFGSTSGSITSLNGAPGYLFDGVLTPFVTQIRPVVADRPVWISPLQARLQMLRGTQNLQAPLLLDSAATFPEEPPHQETPRAAASTAGGISSAEVGALSVAEIRRQRSAADQALQAELDHLLAEARRLESLGNYRDAALCFSKAAARVEGERRANFVARARELRGK